MSVAEDTLKRLDEGDEEHKAALADLKAKWARDDAETKAERLGVLAAFEQGAKDRAEAKARVVAEEPPRMSSLPAVVWGEPGADQT